MPQTNWTVLILEWMSGTYRPSYLCSAESSTWKTFSIRGMCGVLALRNDGTEMQDEMDDSFGESSPSS
jgi:hypothetical protein